MKDKYYISDELPTVNPADKEIRLRAVKRWGKRWHKYNQDEQQLGLASDYLWDKADIEEKLEMIRKHILKHERD